jgi:hypothetical protein
MLRKRKVLMERRYFLKLTFGCIAGGSVLAAGAEAAPLPPVMPEGQGLASGRGEAEPAIVSQDEVDRLAPDQVRWRRRWGHRRRRFWGYRRHWGWPRFHWRWPRVRWHGPHFWRRRFWW